MERYVIFEPSKSVSIDGFHPEQLGVLNLRISCGKDYLNIVCNEALIEDGEYIENYICSIPLQIATFLKNYLTLLTSPSTENSFLDSSEFHIQDAKDEYKIKSRAIEKDYVDEDGLIQRRIAGYDYMLRFPFYHMVCRPGVTAFTPHKYESWGVVFNFTKEDVIEFVRTMTYLRVP